MHGLDFLGKTVVVFFGAIVQLAHRRHCMPLLTQAVVPCGHTPVIGNGIVPEAGLMRIAPSGNGRARRAAQRAGAVSVFKTHAACGDAVDVGCFHIRVAITTADGAIVVITLKKNKISGLGHFTPSLTCARRISGRSAIIGSSPRFYFGKLGPQDALGHFCLVGCLRA